MLAASAKATTASESKFRISYPFTPRDTRVVAVDDQAVPLVQWAATKSWTGNSRFLTVDAVNRAGSEPSVVLCDETGRRCDLADELTGADLVVMVAGHSGAEAAEAIGRASADRRIMTAGVVLGDLTGRVNDAVLALRPYAMVLVPARSDDELLELLAALRV